MEIKKIQIAALIKRVKSRRGGLRSPQIMHPMREWVVGLVVAVLLFSGTALWGVLTYTEYRAAFEIDLVTTEVMPSVYRESQIQQALNDFGLRDELHSSLLNNTEVVPLPAAEETDGDVESGDEQASEVASSTPEVVGEPNETVATSTSSGEVATSSTASSVSESEL